MNSPTKPSSKQNDVSSLIAWTEPKNPKARRVKVWLKKSIHDLASPSAVDFENDPSSSGFRRDAANRPLQSSSSSNISTTTNQKTTATIDQAMFSLHTYVGPKKKVSSVIQVTPETPSSYLPGYDHDWMLDGRDDWRNDDATSQQYLDFLNQPWDMEAYLEKYLHEREETFQKQLEQDEKEFQFEADFDQSGFQPTNPPAEVDSDDDFGDFQDASDSTQGAVECESNDKPVSEGLPNDAATSVESNERSLRAKIAHHTGDKGALRDKEEERLSADEEAANGVGEEKKDQGDMGPNESKQATNNVGKEEEEEEEEKSQEEVIVEEAVEILKSLPSQDFNEAFGDGISPEKRRVLTETCDLVSELEEDESMEENENTKALQKTDGTSQGKENSRDCAESHTGFLSAQVEDAKDDELSPESHLKSIAHGGGQSLGPNEIRSAETGPIMSLRDRPLKTDDNVKKVLLSEGSPAFDVNNERGEQTVDNDDDYSFGDFQDAPVTDVLRPSKALSKIATSNVDPSPGVAASQAQTHPDAAILPTLALLPPPCIESSIDTHKRDHNTREHPATALGGEAQSTAPATIFADEAEDLFQASFGPSISDSEDILSDDESQASDVEEDHFRISLHLPITDLSTPVARFARRQRQKYKEKLRMKDETQDSCSHQTSSVSSLFSALEQTDDDDSEHEPITSLADLDIPHFYFAQGDFDDTTRVLQSAPWHHISHMWDLPADENMGLRIASSYSCDDQQDRQALWDEYITQELCHLDAAQNHVAKHLLRRIRPHEGILQKANQSIHEFSTNLQLAHMYLKRSQASVRQAARGNFDASTHSFDKGSGWFGANELLRAWQQKDMYSDLDTILAKVQELFETERYLRTRISKYTFQAEKPRDYLSILQQMAKLHADVIGNDSFSRVRALDDLRTRVAQNELVKAFQSRLRTLVESVAVRCCRMRPVGLAAEYERLLEAELAVCGLLRIKEQPGPSASLDNGNDGKSQETLRESLPNGTWSKTMLDALCYEADRALATSLLDPVQNPDSESPNGSDSEYERELTELAYELQQDWGDSAKLRTITHNLVILRFNWENTSLSAIWDRLCHQLADVLFAHHLLGQWHVKTIKRLDSHDLQGDEGKEEKNETVEEQIPFASNGNGVIATTTYRQKIVENINDEWNQSRAALWQRCEQALVQCLDEYLHFASSDSFFKGPQNVTEKSQPTEDGDCVANESRERRWLKDLAELHDVLVLTNQFMSLKSRFAPTEGAGCVGDQNMEETKVREKLCDVFRKHLRFVHVEAMKSLGCSLSNESWEIVPLKQLSRFENSINATEASNSKVSFAALLVGTLEVSVDSPIKSRSNAAKQRRSLFENEPETTGSTPNHFLVKEKDTVEETQLHGLDPRNATGNSRARHNVYEVIGSVLAGGDEPNAFTCIVSKSVERVFFSWIVRLLLVMERLPPIVADVSVVFANLCDLYFTTVFRICSGSAKAERILLGVDPPTPFVSSESSQLPLSPPKPEKPQSSSSLFGFRRRSSSSLSGKHRTPAIKVDLPETLESDLCAPTLSEVPSLITTRDFINRAQESLASIVLLDKVDQWLEDPVVDISSQQEDSTIVKAIRNFEKRLGATWSCLGVAVLLDAACVVARRKLSGSPQALQDVAALEHYSQAALSMLPQMAKLSSRIAAVRAVMARRVVTEVVQVGPGWETDRMNEYANDYVGVLCGRCACIWASLSVSPRKLPVSLRRIAWEEVVNSAYSSLLEGFSRVSHCSTEGRALMSIDLADFAAGVNPSTVLERLEYQAEYEAPPKTDSDIGKRYVDTYIKAFYFPPKDVMTWVMEHHEKYKLNHFVRLIVHAYRGSEGADGASIDEALELVKKMLQHEVAG